MIHGTGKRKPNDLKLSDSGVRRGTCMVGGKAAAEAGAVTHGAVRCSAWLGVAVVGKERSKNMKVLEDDCEPGWTTKKLELSGKVAPLASERNGAIERVAATVGESDETRVPVW